MPVSALPPVLQQLRKGRSLAANHLTLERYQRLSTRTTPSGYSLEQLLASGLTHADSNIGIYAGDSDSYSVFADLLLPVIRAYHDIPGRIHHRTDWTPITLSPLDPDRAFIRSTRIRVARNLSHHAFTPWITQEERQSVEYEIIQALNTLPGDAAGTYFPHRACPGQGTEHGISGPVTPPEAQPFPRGDRFQEAAGVNRDWPSGRGIFVSNDARFRVWIQEEDHLRIISQDNSGDLGGVYLRLIQGLDHLSSELSFSRDSTLGYLATCPSNIGTGMRAGVHIHLPRLAERPDMLKKNAGRLGLQIRGTRGEKTAVEDAVFDISNVRRLGITESDCVRTLHHGIKTLIDLERGLI